jgi:predicted RNase H-like HicB family nuclease
MIRNYLGAVCGEAGNFGIVFRDFPGCVSGSDTFEGVLSSGAEALAGHIEGMQEDGELIPLPSEHSLADVLAWLDEANDPSGESWHGVFPVSVEIKSSPQSVALPVDAAMIHEVSAALEENPEADSLRQFVERATRRELARLKRSA